MKHAVAMLSAAVVVVVCAAAPAGAQVNVGIQEIGRLQGEGESVLQGMGLVVGLPGTGDSAKEAAVARPLATMLAAQGNPVDLEDLAKAKSVALVTVTCTIGRKGAYRDDTVDVTVSAVNNPKSLKGGELFLAPLSGPLPGQGVFAIASGPVVIEGENTARGFVRGGARIVQDILNHTVTPDNTVTFLVDEEHAGWSTTTLVAQVINYERFGFEGEGIAEAVSQRAVKVQIPQVNRNKPGSFIAEVLETRFDASLLSLPARVTVNERAGVIVASNDATLSPVTVSQGDMVLSMVVEEGVAGAAIEKTRIEDLLNAFKAMAVPQEARVAILKEIDRIGRLHAELVFSQ